MKKLTWLLRIVGAIQLVLGILYLFVPGALLTAMGHTLPATDIYYPLAMLASRFIIYGVVLIYISNAATQNRLWIDGMILIQVIDLAAGALYTAIGTVPLSLSGFPMFNAMWIIALLGLWRPQRVAA